MVYRELLNLGIDKLKTGGIEYPETDAKLILLDTLGIKSADFYKNIKNNVSKSVVRKYIKHIKKRTKNIPLQYIVKKQEFMSLEFKVDKRVLIPRQDTETLVEYIIKETRELKKNIIKILDIGTGSGCIAISLAKYIDNAEITAVDISKKAICIAKQNSRLNGVSSRIVFLKSDMYKNLNVDKFDFIVSNPPYIKKSDKHLLDRHVLKEPAAALFSGGNGYDHIQRLIEGGRDFLENEGRLAIETGFDQSAVTRDIFTKYRYSDIKTIKDYNGIERVVSGKNI